MNSWGRVTQHRERAPTRSNHDAPLARRAHCPGERGGNGAYQMTTQPTNGGLMADETTPALPEAQTREFDFWDDTICVPGRDDFIAEQPDHLRDILEAALPDPTQHRGARDILDLLETAQDALPDETSEDITDALDGTIHSVRAHVDTGCGCSYEAWSWAEGDIEAFLTELGGHWALFDSDGAPVADATDLDFAGLRTAALGHRDGWREVSIAWDGKATLDVTFGTDSYSSRIVGHRLTPEQVETAEIADENGVDEPYCFAAQHAVDVITFAAEIYDASSWFPDRLYFDDVVTDLEPTWPLSDEAQDAALIIAATWESDIPNPTAAIAVAAAAIALPPA